MKAVLELSIPVPPLEVQGEIVRILDNFTELTAALTAALTARKKQYEYYRNKLLTFDDTVPLVKIGSCCKLVVGGDVPKDRYSKDKTEQFTVPIYSNGYEDKALYGYTDIEKITVDSVTIAGRGVGVGYCALRKAPYYPIIRLICAIPNTQILTANYLKYAVQCIEFKIPTAGIPQLTVPMVKEYKIPLPSLEEQKRIVSILDRFDALCNDISIGLPAEIEARKKQYEYYRYKLLTFKSKNSEVC